MKDASISLEEQPIMDKFIPVAKLKDIKAGEPFCAEVEGKSLAIYKVGDNYFATTGVCTHAGGPLCQGELNEGVVTCPWHGSRFEVDSGKVVHGPAQGPIKTYKTKINGDTLEANLV